MPDLQQYVASLRARLADFDRRRAELDAVRAEVERKRERLTVAIAVYEEGLSGAASVERSPAPRRVPRRGKVPVSDRVLDCLISSGPKTRQDLVRLLCPSVNPNTLDSALTRLKNRRAIRRDDDSDWYVAVDPSTAPSVTRVPSDAGDVPDDPGEQLSGEAVQRLAVEPAGSAAPSPGD